MSAPAGSNTTSVQRSPNGGDSNNNVADFIAAAPSPGSAGPTAGNATVSGRVVMNRGKGFLRAQLILTDGAGNSRVVKPNMFGHYRFAEVPTGETYILNIRSKGFHFKEPTRVITVTEDLNGVDFVGF